MKAGLTIILLLLITIYLSLHLYVLSYDFDRVALANDILYDINQIQAGQIEYWRERCH